jgi:hypothetical protein
MHIFRSISYVRKDKLVKYSCCIQEHEYFKRCLLLLLIVIMK